jgi:phosphocarrier protein
VIEQPATVTNPLGVHARPAAQLVRLSNTFQSEIQFVKDGVPVNGKSIMGVMMLAAECGSTILVRAEGSDAEAAVAALTALITSGFGES